MGVIYIYFLQHMLILLILLLLLHHQQYACINVKVPINEFLEFTSTNKVFFCAVALYSVNYFISYPCRYQLFRQFFIFFAVSSQIRRQRHLRESYMFLQNSLNPTYRIILTKYYLNFSVSKFNEFEPWLKSAKNRFLWSFKCNQQYLSCGLNLSRGSNSLNLASGCSLAHSSILALNHELIKAF